LIEDEIKQIVNSNNLQTNSKAGKIYYDNMSTKNRYDKFYIRIESNQNMKLMVSFHKYKNYLETGMYDNSNLFSMNEVSKTAEAIGTETGLKMDELNVYGYEIGMNLYLSKDCRKYLDKIQTIGILEAKREFFVNPKYKNERLKTTYFYREMRKVFKVYDKNFEMTEKKRLTDPEHPFILRIETVFNRVEKMTMLKFLSPENMQRMADQFIRDWRTICFDCELTVPKGTPTGRVNLCKEILRHGKETVLKKARDQHKAGDLTEKRFRGIREFIQNDWDTIKNAIRKTQSVEEQEFRKIFEETYKIVKY